MEDVYYLPPGSGEEFYFAANPFDKDYIRGVDEADGPSFSGEFTLDYEFREGLDEQLLEILYGDRIRKTTERLNNEWLKKMWKASDDDIMVFRFEQIAKRLDSSFESMLSVRERLEDIRRRDIQLFNYEKTSQSEQGSSV